jgi:hypothetical protein
MKKQKENSRKSKEKIAEKAHEAQNICTNASCRLRKAGCMGFEGCPGYKAGG